MIKKYNDKSNNITDWSVKKLKQEALGYYETIYKVECYGVKDMMMFSAILAELDKRKIKYDYDLHF